MKLTSPNVSATIVLFSFMLTGFYEPLYGQNKTDAETNGAFINWVKTHALPLDSNNLAPFSKIVGPARAVALGEPAHGFHQSLAFRNRMFRYLVEHLKFTTIVLETNLAKTKLAADFVAGGRGTAEQAAQALTIGDPTSEDVELLRWMREYNQQPAHSIKTKIYGMDIEMTGLPGDTVPSHPAVDNVLGFLEHVDHHTAMRFSKTLKPFLGRMSVANYPKMSKIQHDQLRGQLDKLIAAFREHRSSYIKASTKADFEWAYQNAIAAIQTDQIVRLLPPEVPGKIPPDAWRAASARDSAMAENVKWVLALEKNVFIYAHNAHMKNAPTTGSVWDAFQQPPNSTGQYLRKALGNSIVIFGISFDPSFDLKQPRSLEAALFKTGMTNFLIDLNGANADPGSSTWLAEMRPMQANVVAYFNLALAKAFDAIVYLGKVSPSVRIKKEN